MLQVQRMSTLRDRLLDAEDAELTIRIWAQGGHLCEGTPLAVGQDHVELGDYPPTDNPPIRYRNGGIHLIPRVVTTAGPAWESELVERARAGGTLRIVKRAFHPEPVHRTLAEGRARAVVVGVGIPWLSPGLVSAWRNVGAVVIGIDDPHHPPSRRLLEDWGCHIVLDEPDPEWAAASLSATLPSLTPSPYPPPPTVVAVGGPRGAPGRTEVALGIAWLAARAWFMSADRGRHLSRSGSAAGTAPTHRASPGGDRRADRLAAVGSPRIIRRDVEKRLVASLGLPDSGGGSRPRDLRVWGLARPEGRGLPSQSPGNSADRLPTGEAGQRTAFPNGDKPASARRSPRSGDLTAPGIFDGRPACRLDHGTGRPGMGDASSPFHPGCAGASHGPAGAYRRTITERPDNSPASAGG